MKVQFIILLLITLTACAQQSKQVASPTHYDFSKPEKFNMPNSLFEISGIAFNGTNDDTIYAEQDEEGILFHFKPGSNTIMQTKFGKKGDYEDVAICNKNIIMLRSDGTLYTFPLSQANNKKVDSVKEWPGLLLPGEYEGLYADAATNKLYILCKHCSEEKTSKQGGGSIFSISADGNIAPSGSFNIRVKDIEKLTGQNKIAFHPSAITRNSNTNQWYILSSVNSLLVITDSNWQVTEVYPLDAKIFVQPEGITSDKQHNLYISNEGSATSSGNILKFAYKP